MGGNEIEWRKLIADRLRERNKCEVTGFSELIVHSKFLNYSVESSVLFCFVFVFIFHTLFLFTFPDNRLFDQNSQLKSENLRLNIEMKTSTGMSSTLGGNANVTSSKIQALEKKLLTQQEELTDLHKRKGENSQMIVEMNIKLVDQTKTLTEKEKALAAQIAINTSLKAEVKMLTTSIEELKNINSTVRDEHMALQLAFNSLEEKFRKCQVCLNTLNKYLICGLSSKCIYSGTKKRILFSMKRNVKFVP